MNSQCKIPARETHALPLTFPVTVACILLLSGVFHLAAWKLSGQSWEGPLSLRKPALFGVSGGMTVFSICWIVSKLRSRRENRILVNAAAEILLVEVLLITIQCWRGVPSHFNRTTVWNSLVDDVMLGGVSVLTALFVWLGFRSRDLPDVVPADRIALRGGIWLLVASCVLGYAVTVSGYANLSGGRPPETWGNAGALKFPHGAALHAIQLLPVISWVARRFLITRPDRLVWMALLSQALLLAYAVRQTLLGMSRLDSDALGYCLLLTSMLSLAIPSILIAIAIIKNLTRGHLGLVAARPGNCPPVNETSSPSSHVGD